MAELVDALDLGSSGATRESSSLSFRTNGVDNVCWITDSSGVTKQVLSREFMVGHGLIRLCKTGFESRIYGGSRTHQVLRKKFRGDNASGG